MIRIQYDVFVSHYYDFDDYTDFDTGSCDDDDVNPMKLLFQFIVIMFIMMILFQFIVTLFQFIVTPSNFEKPIKLQLPILLATYPLRSH